MVVERSLSRRDALIGAGLATGGLLASYAPVAEAARYARAQARTVTITVREHQPTRLRLLRREIPRFKQVMAARRTPVDVQVQVGPTDDNTFLTGLTAAYATGTGPDVTSFPVSWTPEYILSHALRDITPQVSGWSEWTRDWYPLVRHATTFNGRVYYVPREATVFNLYYRKDILASHGISTAQPRTWDELLARAREIKRKTRAYALCFPAGVQWGPGTFDEGFIHLMLGSGSPIYNERTRRWVVKSPGLRRVFAFYATAAKEGLLPVKWLNMPNPWIPTKYTAFPRGDLLITTGGSWAWEFDWGPSGQAPIPHLFEKVATWSFPSVEGRPFTTGGIGWAWAIAAASRQPAAAWEFVKFMTSGQALADTLIAIGAVSPRRNIAAEQREYGRLSFLVAAERTLNTSRSFIPRSGEASIQQFIGEATQSLITGAATPDQAMAAFAAKATAALGPYLVETE